MATIITNDYLINREINKALINNEPEEKLNDLYEQRAKIIGRSKSIYIG